MIDTDVQNPIRILLIEDNPHDRRAFHRALKKSELRTQITDCKRAEAALELLTGEGAQWDVVVSDHDLPGASGLDLYRQLEEKQLRLPFILLTGVGSELLAVKALKLGVDDYLSKNAGPIYAEQLPTTIARVHRIHRDRESDRRKDEFLATLAHELRNPLAPLCSGGAGSGALAQIAEMTFKFRGGHAESDASTPSAFAVPFAPCQESQHLAEDSPRPLRVTTARPHRATLRAVGKSVLN
jgi:CheY-like chemotaxis protein